MTRIRNVLIAGLSLATIVMTLASYAYAVSDTVQVSARVNPAFSMTCSASAVDMGVVGVGTTTMPDAVTITVRSNRTWSWSCVETADAEMIFSETPSFAYGAARPRGVIQSQHDYVTTVLDTTKAGDFFADYTYTAVQD